MILIGRFELSRLDLVRLAIGEEGCLNVLSNFGFFAAGLGMEESLVELFRDFEGILFSFFAEKNEEKL